MASKIIDYDGRMQKIRLLYTYTSSKGTVFYPFSSYLNNYKIQKVQLAHNAI